MSAHTPGPWSVEIEEGFFPVVRLIPSHLTGQLTYSDGSWSEYSAKSVGRVVINQGTDPDGLARGIVANRMTTCEANAHLIAAAPSYAKAWAMVPEEIRERILSAIDSRDAAAIDRAEGK